MQSIKKKRKNSGNIKNDLIKFLNNYNNNDDTKEDIYRLCLLFYLCNSKNLTNEDIKRLEPYIMNQNAINYIKKKIEETSIRESNNMNMRGQ